VCSVTDKQFPEIVGDGSRSLRRLIYDDERAVCMARVYIDRFGARALDVPGAGERVRLVEIGSHCRGAVFLDGRALLTPELAHAVDELARGFEGFHFGRFDIRIPAGEDLACGRGFKVVELNGVTAEATHIYDPDTSLLEAYRVVFEQWRIAFAIGAANRAGGARVTPLRELIRRIGDFLERG
jgi:hypothetical protein